MKTEHTLELMYDEMTDADIIDFVDQYMGQLIHKFGHRWYWRRRSSRTHYRAESLRDAIEKAVKEIK